ncbi:MAG: MATE family efflux transporter [Alistipes sp.]|nr:MATE family efflux transporter [Alistipes sp.]
MGIFGSNKDRLLELIRSGSEMTLRQQFRLTVLLSIPAIMAQMSNIIMEYIDAAMVGSLGAHATASIGLVATSTWLLWGICASASTGFAVQVAHLTGAGDNCGARDVVRQSLTAAGLFGLAVAAAGTAVSSRLPVWLGGEEEIVADAAIYFRIFVLSLPVLQLLSLSGAMLRCSGNILVPSVTNVAMCVLDVLFNFFLIFPSRTVTLAGAEFQVWGAGLGVKGAAIGTAAASVIGAAAMLWYMCCRSRELRLAGTHGSFRPRRQTLAKALKIAAPIGVERLLFCGAYITVTVIVAPLGAVAIAAHSLAVTAESLCYMPGYGIGDAATTAVGQSIGAGRPALARRFSRMTVWTGVGVMTFMGAVMYFAAPLMMGLITPVEAIRAAGVEILRIEAFAEPMFAASIVAYGVFVGAGDTLIPCCMNLGSMWAVRLTLAAALAPALGLKGVWIAMCVELCFRGVIFLWRLYGGRWIKIPDNKR